jgi:RIO-like serine/threonine protein kinase
MRECLDLQASRSKLLKKDIFGRTELLLSGADLRVRRDARAATSGVRWIARKLLAREARALAVLEGTGCIPRLLQVDHESLERSYIDGSPMQEGKPTDPRYFRAAAKLLRRLHRQNVVHNDLAKEPNFLVTCDGRPAIIDFQLAWFAPRRGPLFRMLAREDIRHLLKHKRTYCSQHLTHREQQILDNPSMPARLWMHTVKPVYLFVTRRILGWQDREGAGDRA